MWALEDDILHPQIYPMRITDYLTRKINAGGILEKAASENNMLLQYRELRSQ